MSNFIKHYYKANCVMKKYKIPKNIKLNLIKNILMLKLLNKIKFKTTLKNKCFKPTNNF